ERRRQDEVPVADRGEIGAETQGEGVGEQEVAEEPAHVESEVLVADALAVGDEDVVELELGDGAKALEAVEDEEDVEAIEGDLVAGGDGFLGLDGGEAADHQAERADAQAAARTVLQRPGGEDRRLAQGRRLLVGTAWTSECHEQREE